MMMDRLDLALILLAISAVSLAISAVCHFLTYMLNPHKLWKGGSDEEVKQ